MHSLLAVTELSVMQARHPDALSAIRIAGVAYLLYRGGRLIVHSSLQYVP